MTDRPILFSAPMVRALLDGRKTMTRRLAWRRTKVSKARAEALGHTILYGSSAIINAPTIWQKVRPGDRLWVRETWGPEHRGDSTPGGKPYDPSLLYRATDDEPGTPQWEPFRWRPSIHMPRRFSRLSLVVTGTKMERLWSLSTADERAEGFDNEGLAFAEFWDALHGNGAWEDNPEVVALTFTVHKANIDAPS